MQNENFNFITIISGLEFRRIFLEVWNVPWNSGENSLWSSWLLQSRSVAIPGSDDMTVQAWRLADAYMGLVSASGSTGWGIFRLHPKQLNLNQFLETGPQVSECTDPLSGMLRCSQDENHYVKDEWRLGYLESWWLWFSQIQFFHLISKFFSTLHFVTFPPVLKINCLFIFPTSSLFSAWIFYWSVFLW